MLLWISFSLCDLNFASREAYASLPPCLSALLLLLLLLVVVVDCWLLIVDCWLLLLLMLLLLMLLLLWWLIVDCWLLIVDVVDVVVVVVLMQHSTHSNCAWRPAKFCLIIFDAEGDATDPAVRERVMKWSFMVTKEEIKDFSAVGRFRTRTCCFLLFSDWKLKDYSGLGWGETFRWWKVHIWLHNLSG